MGGVVNAVKGIGKAISGAVTNPIGTAIGLGTSALGGVLGAQNKVDEKNPYQVNETNFKDPYLTQNLATYNQRIAEAQKEMAPIVGSPDLGAQQQFQNRQFGLADILQSQIQGNAPSAAQLQLQQGQEQGLKNAIALAASQRGNQNPAILQRNLMNQFAQGQGNLNQQMALLRAQEAQGATGNLVNLLGQGGNQALGGAQLQQQTSMANQQAQLQQQAQRNQLVEYYTQLGYNAEQAQLAALMDMERLKSQNYNGVLSSNMTAQLANQRQNNDVLGGALKAGGSILGMATGPKAAPAPAVKG